MSFIRQPNRAKTDAKRFADCQDALEPYVQGLIALAVAAKWGDIEATEAIIALAEQHVISIGSSAEFLDSTPAAERLQMMP